MTTLHILYFEMQTGMFTAALTVSKMENEKFSLKLFYLHTHTSHMKGCAYWASWRLGF